jgi:hypothetical protein
MVAFVTLQQAKRHLRIAYGDEDEDLQDKVEQASAIIVDYLKMPDHGWTDAQDGSPPTRSTAPMVVQAATLLMLSTLWEFREGEAQPNYNQADGYLPKAVTALLHRLREPAYA